MGSSSAERWRIAVSLGAAVLACGLPLWPIPYDRVSLPGNPSFATWLLCGASAGCLGGLLLRRRHAVALLTVPAGFVLAVLGRVGVETSRDPTSHNLWPFEVVIAGGIGTLAGLIGVGAARLVQRLGRAARASGS